MATHVRKGSKCTGYLGNEMMCSPDTFGDIEDEQEYQVLPTNSLTDNDDLPIDLNFTGTPDWFILFCHSYIHIIIQIVKKNGEKISVTDIVSPINLLAHALFNQIDLYINEVLVSKNSGHYGFKAYIGTMCGYSNIAKKSGLQTELFFIDGPGEDFDATVIERTKNPGIVLRNELGAESRFIDMVFKPHLDMFNQGRPIPPSNDIRLRLNRTSPEFCLMYDGTEEFKIKITTATLYLRALKMASNVTLSHKETLLHNGKYNYPIKRVVVTTFTIPSSVMSHTKPHVVQGQLPRYIIMGLTTNKAFSGNYKKSPFRFSPYYIRKTNLLVNGICVPTRPYCLNFDDSKKNGLEFTRCFRTLNSLLEHNNGDMGNSITRKMYADGFTLIPFIIQPNYDPCSLGLIKEGNIQLELEFAKPTENVLNAVLYMEFENNVTIGKNFDVNVDY